MTASASTLTGEDLENLGHALAVGDGCAEVLVGAPGSRSGGQVTGRVYVLKP